MSPVLIIIQAGVLCKWTNDTQRFLLEHFDAIHDSPSQIYYFALPFSPSTSWLQKCYSAELPNGVKVVRGLPLGWGTCSRTVSLNVEPQTISCWNNTVAVCLQSSSIIILNAVTGSQTAVFSGHTSIVTSSTFSQVSRTGIFHVLFAFIFKCIDTRCYSSRSYSNTSLHSLLSISPSNFVSGHQRKPNSACIQSHNVANTTLELQRTARFKARRNNRTI